MHSRTWIVAVLGAFSVACAPSLEVTPETRVASAVQVLASEAEAFKRRRRDIVKTRLEILASQQEGATRLKSDTVQRRTIWELVDDKARIAAHDRVMTATKATGAAWAAQEELARRQAKAVEEADTRFALSAETLARIVKALTALGTPEGREEQARFYAKFIIEAVDKTRAAPASPPPKPTP